MEEDDGIIELVFVKDKNERKGRKNKPKTKGTYQVYLLPKENYVGVSGEFKRRLNAHKHNGKDTEGAEVLFTIEGTKKEAYYIEMRVQTEMGYKGYQETWVNNFK